MSVYIVSMNFKMLATAVVSPSIVWLFHSVLFFIFLESIQRIVHWYRLDGCGYEVDGLLYNS